MPFISHPEIKAFLAVAGFRPAANPRMIRQFLEFNFLADEHRSSLEGVLKLPAGHSHTVRRSDVEARLRPRPVSSSPAARGAVLRCGRGNEAPSTDQLANVLDQVVRQHMIADVPVGVLLSGGTDSGLVAALASRHARVRTICMAFADSGVDEPFARLVSKAIGSEHEEVVISPAEVVAGLEQAVWFIDDLFGDYRASRPGSSTKNVAQPASRWSWSARTGWRSLGGYPIT